MDYKAFSISGIDGLKLQEGRGCKHMLSEVEIEQVKQWIKEDSGLTIQAVRLKIESSFTKKLSMGGGAQFDQKTGVCYITARSSHYKKDESSHEE